MKTKFYCKLLLVLSFVMVLSFTFAACGGKEAPAPEKPSTTSEVPRETPIPGKTGGDNPVPSATSSFNTDGLRPVDQKILGQMGASASGDKIKDAFPKESYKVNFYKEATDKTWARLKIDLNRNEKWDEKWDLANGQPVKRQVASKDDENYDQTFVWKNGKWEAEK